MERPHQVGEEKVVKKSEKGVKKSEKGVKKSEKGLQRRVRRDYRGE
jgi:hypothetical protein